MDKRWLKNYPDGVVAKIDLNDYSSLAELFHRSTQRYADQTAFVSLGHTMSFQGLDQLSRRMAGYLTIELGLQQGDRIALMLPNVLQYPVAFFAAIRAGLTVVNLDPLCTQRELRYQLQDAGCRCVVTLEDCARKLSNIIEDTPVEFVIKTQVADLLGVARKTALNFQHKWLSGKVPIYHLKHSVCFNKTIRAMDERYADPIIHPQDLALIQYTSGTEGVPKGVMLSHFNLASNTQQSVAWAANVLTTDQETLISALPLCHLFALTATLLVPLKIGARNLLSLDARDCHSIIQLLEQYPVSMLVGVSTYFRELVRTEGFQQLDFSFLKLSLCGGMPIHRSVIRDWAQITGIPIVECYGMTETSPAVTINPLNLDKYNGTVGLPLPSTEVSIRDLSGHELGSNQAGEIWVRGPQVMLGYWQKPRASQHCLTENGWFKTGDVGVLSKTGYLTVIDRIRDIINVSGFIVYPSELEQVVMTLEPVVDAAAVAIPDERSGEAVKLYVIASDSAVIDSDRIHSFCKSKLSAYKCPKSIEFVDKIPRQKTGRLLRRELRKASVH